MKKIALFTLCALAAVMFTSCGKDSYKSFVGTWGVEKIEYYNIDYAGNPISSTIETYNFVPGDEMSGIDLIFRDDKTGEMRDRSQDTIYVKDYSVDPPVIVDTIICPDTTLVTKFTYSYDKSSSVLYMDMEYIHTYRMHILSLESNSFIYENEYGKDYVEKAYMKRISNTPTVSTNRNATIKPNKPGSILGNRK